MIKKENSEEEYQKAKEMLKHGLNGFHNEPYIKRQLHENENLRRVFLAIVCKSPSRISEIIEYSLLSRNTCYSMIFKLINLKLVDRIYINKIVDGTLKNDEIKNKVDEWTRTMPENMKRYYISKTSYFVITDFGKKFAKTSLNFENEFRVEEKNGDSD